MPQRGGYVRAIGDTSKGWNRVATLYRDDQLMKNDGIAEMGCLASRLLQLRRIRTATSEEAQ